MKKLRRAKRPPRWLLSIAALHVVCVLYAFAKSSHDEMGMFWPVLLGFPWALAIAWSVDGATDDLSAPTWAIDAWVLASGLANAAIVACAAWLVSLAFRRTAGPYGINDKS